MKVLMILLTLILFAGCGADKIRAPLAEADSSSGVGISHGESETSNSYEDFSSEALVSEADSVATWERFEQITSRPLREWTTKDFSEFFSMSSRELDLSIANNIGFEHFVFDIMGANVGFPNDTHYMIKSEYPLGFLIFEKYKSNDVVTYPLIATVVCEEQSILLGADLGTNVGDIMDVFGHAAIEYVVRDVGMEKERFYFVRYSIDGLVFLFDCGVPSEFGTSSSHPTMNEVLSSRLRYVNILKEDCYLLERLDASILKE